VNFDKTPSEALAIGWRIPLRAERGGDVPVVVIASTFENDFEGQNIKVGDNEYVTSMTDFEELDNLINYPLHWLSQVVRELHPPANFIRDSVKTASCCSLSSEHFYAYCFCHSKTVMSGARLNICDRLRFKVPSTVTKSAPLASESAFRVLLAAFFKAIALKGVADFEIVGTWLRTLPYRPKIESLPRCPPESTSVSYPT
jgi:hypothetical protein